MFGDGLVEMIGVQLRLQALALADANRDGWISKEEAKGKRCVIRNIPNGVVGDRMEIMVELHGLWQTVPSTRICRAAP